MAPENDVPAGFEPLTDLGPFVELIGPVYLDRFGGRLAFGDCSVRVDDEEIVRARAVFAVRSTD